MPTTGLLPASGKASRILGLPKFAIPISDNETLLSWHVTQLIEVCDRVIVSTRREWFPIIESMDLPVELVIREPSTLSETLGDLFALVHGDVIFGMPDTAIIGNSLNPYANLLNSGGDITLGLFKCTDVLQGKVGQVRIENNVVVDVQDKSSECTYPLMWGNILFRENFQDLNLGINTPSTEISRWIRDGVRVESAINDGQYVDVGTFWGLKYLMSLV